MTAEAIVMNRSAIALAADSAVTISGPRASKTFDTANKLFELIKGCNIGVMVYNNMMLNATPWETIIKAYRNEHSDFRAPQVTDYLEHFLTFLGESKYVLPSDEDFEGALSLAFDSLVSVALELQARYAEYVTVQNKIVKTKANVVLTEICDDWEDEIKDLDDLSAAQHLSVTALTSAFKEPLRELTEEIFDGFGVRPALINRLTSLAIKSMTKDSEWVSDSGLVFAGFGTKEYFPSYATTSISARLLGQVVTKDSEILSVTDVPESGFIRTFAQDEPAHGWITGISQQTRSLIQYYWTLWARRELATQLRQSLPNQTGFNRTLRAAVTREVLKLAREQVNEFFEFMDDYEYMEFIHPMYESVSALPKDELGLLAESLVNITSLKQRMSVHQSNTVGGAIDVAVISVGDGFVWINRKHYFDEKFNPTWHLTHGAKINTRVGNTIEGGE